MEVVTRPESTQLRVDHPSAVHAATRAARDLAHCLGMPDVLAERAAVIAAELAGNLCRHAENGTVVVQPALPGPGVDVLTADAGPGMADVPHWMVDGNTTTATLGTGLGAVRRMATAFHVHSEPGTGTRTAARLLVPGTPSPATGHFCLPRDGEQACGDAIALHPSGDGTTALLVDGLGHGADAAEAAEAAVEVFTRAPDRPLPEQLAAMHRMLTRTRGAAAALLRVRGEEVEFCGVGNVTAAVLAPGAPAQLLLSVPGIVGFRLPHTPVRQLRPTRRSTLVLHSDGVAPDWRDGTLGARPPLLLAAELLHRARDPRDDSSMLALTVDDAR